MRVSRTRFSKRRSKRKTEFPIVAVVQKKRKAEYLKSQSFGSVNNKLAPTKQLKDPKSLTQPLGQGFSQSSVANQRFASPTNKSPKKSRATIDYKNVSLLRNLITAEGKILPRRINKLTAKQQRSVQKAIKSARVMGLVPFINKSRPF